jgi:hypothetical protein
MLSNLLKPLCNSGQHLLSGLLSRCCQTTGVVKVLSGLLSGSRPIQLLTET